MSTSEAPHEATDIDIDHLRTWIDRTSTTTDVATAAKSAGLRALLDYAQDPWGGALFPLAHWLQFNPDAPQSELAADGHPHKGSFLPPIPLPRRMWAGSQVSFQRPIRVGDNLQQVSTIRDVSHKTGRSGQLVFLKVDHEIYANDKLATTDVHTIVYREAPTGPTTSPAQTAAERGALTPADTSGWDYSLIVAPDETMLLRYSALTFNAHRIHYDRDYCINVEGYPGLVVHGPLSATLMLESFMRHNRGSEVLSFSFSARQPIFDHTPVAYVGKRSSDTTTELAALNPANEVCLSGTVTHPPLG